MKLLILSDSHRNIDHMQYASEQTQPDAILHLGDHLSDAHELQRRLPGIAFHAVKGNCDFQAIGEIELMLTLEGVKIYMTHGHIYRVKNGLHAFVEGAQKNGANLALYGHTHQAMIRQMPGMWIMNPGQMERHDSSRAASYGIVTIENGAFECDIAYLPR